MPDIEAVAAAGRIELVVTTLASARSLVEGGQLRLLATAAAERDPQMPNVPAAPDTQEAFAAEVRGELTRWHGIAVRAGAARN